MLHNLYLQYVRFGIQNGESGLILGAAFLEKMTVVHDRVKSRVGFKLADSCTGNIMTMTTTTTTTMTTT